PAEPLALPVLPVTAVIGGQHAEVIFAGLAPGYMGALQLNLRVPNLASGDYPLVVTIGAAQSNAPLLRVAGTGSASPSIVRTIAYHQITSYAESDANGYRGSTAISGNGALIAFAKDVSPTRGQNQVYAMNFAGTNPHLVDSYTARCFCGSTISISDDASKIAITEGRQIRAGGSALLTAEDGAVSGISGMALEGDGKRIFFLVGRDTNFGPAPHPVPFLRGLYVMNWDGSGMRQIVGPTAVAALLGTTASSYWIPEFASTGNTPNGTLSVSADGARIVFAAKAGGSEGIFGVNLDGSNLHLILGPVPYVYRLAISSDGTKVLYDARVSGSLVDTGAVNFDGTNRVRLRQDGIGNTPGVQLTADGSQLLAYDILYNTDGSAALQLGTLLNWFTMASPASGSAVMNQAGTRFVYSWIPPKTFSQGFSQLVTAEINPGNLGSAPAVSNISTTPHYAVAGGNPLSTVTASVTPYDRILGVNYALVRSGLVEDSVTADIGLGPIPSANGVFSAKNVEAQSKAPVGPRLLRLFAWVKDAGGAWHGTLIDLTPYSVVLTPPGPGEEPAGSVVLSASASSLDFGTVSVGQTKDLTVTVTNTGSASVTLTGSVAGPFRLQPASFTLSAGAQQTVTVRFAPVDATPQNATITFRGDDAAASTMTVAALGAGRSATPAAVVITSDSFQRADSAHNVLGVTDLALGGTRTFCYIPIWTGDSIASNSLQNWGTGAGGVQFGQPSSGSSCSFRGVNMGQSFNIRAEVLVPADSAGNSTVAGPYFHSRGAAAADGIMGGDSAGYWVELESSGRVTILDLHSTVAFARTSTPAGFDHTVFHTLEAAVTATTLQVTLDGSLLSFILSDGTTAQTVTIPATAGSNDGTAGIGFQRVGPIGGQRARNLVVTEYRALAAP
ncbi:MAG TPA: choice-of-anchor D domain-containing protein, partial [Bryobacteraceae bacterium]|nr:choice-of-anchor D domain-containing protein [Bryobacteraceae bacterium]